MKTKIFYEDLKNIDVENLSSYMLNYNKINKSKIFILISLKVFAKKVKLIAYYL